MSTLDPDSGETVPENATSPFPNPCETPQDYDAQAQSRLALQYRESTKLKATVSALVAPMRGIEECIAIIPILDDPTVPHFAPRAIFLSGAGSVVASTGTWEFDDGAFTAADIGALMTVAGATNGGNNGVREVLTVPDGTHVTTAIASLVNETFARPAVTVTIARRDINLDVTAELVGQSRVLKNGTVVNDTAYRTYIAMRIQRNISHGDSPGFIAALTIIFGATPFRFYDLGGMYVALELATGVAPSSDTIALLDRYIGPVPIAMGVDFGREWYDSSNYFAFAEDAGGGAKGFGEIGDATQGGRFAELF